MAKRRRKYTLEGKRMTKGERRVAIELKSLGLKYVHDKTYPGLVNELGNKMRFDFIVHTPEGHVAIEYDGEQHFRPVSFGGDDSAAEIRFNRTKIGDEMKNQFCIDNGIPLLRIPYFEENIRRCIKQFLSNSGVATYGDSTRTTQIVSMFFEKKGD